jgi:hypothetical protein
VVECFLAKEDVAGSTPVSRSIKFPVCDTLFLIDPGVPEQQTPRGAVPKW